MNLKAKKIVAREFLIVIGATLLIGIFWVFLTLRNSYLENGNEKIRKKISFTENEIDQIKSKYTFEYDEYGVLIKRSSSTWQPPDDAILVDTILEKLNKKRYTEDGLPILQQSDQNDPFGLRRKLRELKEPSLQAIDSLDNLTSQLTKEENELKTHSRKILTNNDILSFVTVFGIVVLSIIYPFRLIILSILWAIRTLRT